MITNYKRIVCCTNKRKFTCLFYMFLIPLYNFKTKWLRGMNRVWFQYIFTIAIFYSFNYRLLISIYAQNTGLEIERQGKRENHFRHRHFLVKICSNLKIYSEIISRKTKITFLVFCWIRARIYFTLYFVYIKINTKLKAHYFITPFLRDQSHTMVFQIACHRDCTNSLVWPILISIFYSV